MLGSNPFRNRHFVASALLILLAKPSQVALGKPLPKAAARDDSDLSLLPWRNWATYSPYPAFEEWIAPPKTCTISQVNILQRDGVRALDRRDALPIQATLKKIVGKKAYARPEMEFLESYTYDVGTSASLMPVGAQQYCGNPHINIDKPCGAAFDSPSVTESAGNWSHAFTEVSHQFTATQVVLAECEGAQNTLRSHCPRLSSSVPKAQEQWRAHWTPAVIERLQSHEDYGLTGTVSDDACEQGGVLTDPGHFVSPWPTTQDIANLAHLCAFESMQKRTISPFCGLFLPSELASIEYDGDLSAYYDHAYPGAPLARSQGVGYVHELLSRLTGDLSFVTKDRTQVDRALDTKESSSFPLDEKIYADFTHDTQLLAVMTLMGLFQDRPLHTTAPDPHRSFIASQIVPFSGRLVVERLECTGQKGDSFGRFAGVRKQVRIYVNDRAMDLSKICGKANTHSQDTICPLSVFVDAMKRVTTTATKEFAKCGVVPN
ncbi:BQ2448_7967 [Microbotryum intermedium]|uniref:BQ2448_7967 protein n=1 Tax=Microbotryum intermedium TaxID=269621 RepID=A0A238FUP5_9BASI|nr:BQ2448_7967 [Microbotryum intermedium]